MISNTLKHITNRDTCHHMLAAVQTQGGPHPEAVAHVLGLVGWTREAGVHCLPLQTPLGQLLQPLVLDVGQPVQNASVFSAVAAVSK